MTEEFKIRRFKIVCAYDGTNYYGWQRLPELPSVQETIEKTLAAIVKLPTVTIHSSGRTDHGVHGHGQTFHVDLPTRMTVRSLRMALNGRLPADIRIRACAEVDENFHARFSAHCKEYRYYIWNTRVMPPNKRLYNAHVVKPLDLKAIREALPYFLGEHDFLAFAANPDRPVASTVRTIFAFTVHKSGSQIVFHVRGNGFLYKMVRSLVGFLIRVGSGQEKPEAVKELLDGSAPRTARVPSAPPQGLTLWQVWYE